MAIREVVDLNGETINIFVNATTGSDITGQGTSAKPYATLARALEDVPLKKVLRQNTIKKWRNGTFFIFLAGTNSPQNHVVPDAWEFPPFVCEDPVVIGSAEIDPVNLPGYKVTAPLNIVAIPAAPTTILAGNIAAQTVRAISSLFQIDLTVGIGDQKGKWGVDAAGETFFVPFNDTGDATIVPTTSIFGPFVAPIDLYAQKGRIVSTNLAQFNSTVTFKNVQCGVSFYGLIFQASTTPGFPSLTGGNSFVYFTACQVEGHQSGVGQSSGNLISQNVFDFENSQVTDFAFHLSGEVIYNQCYHEDVDYSQCSNNALVLFIFGYFEACEAIGQGNETSMLSPAQQILFSCDINNGLGDGIAQQGGALLLSDTAISGCAAAGIFVNRGANAVCDNVSDTVSPNGTVGIRLRAQSIVDGITLNVAGAVDEANFLGQGDQAYVLGPFSDFALGSGPTTLQDFSQLFRS